MPQAFGELTVPLARLLPKLEDYLLIETFGTGREGYNASHCMCLFPGESDFLTVGCPLLRCSFCATGERMVFSRYLDRHQIIEHKTGTEPKYFGYPNISEPDLCT
ncbi:hypothetical protein YC2023_036499 [Brassica napus]